MMENTSMKKALSCIQVRLVINILINNVVKYNTIA